ncbi:phosphoribosylanthranilate isomerase [Fulvivirgaceae bacterium BMA10]|uniref:N-(5'-phosphoribosyl)anthranilate isomerase n=1 Tax=Splendidivirga corallicola TaxID=3051826 RepID=A0ABT8KNU4_9BACT|nr:phosphoribosylanthranilate isomerase [Fulvivirgaceae bacterium BMA10]
MALKTFVKISGVNNLSDARYCAGMGVDLLGFSLDGSEKEIVDPKKFEEITGWVSGVEFVGEFNQVPMGNIEETLEQYDVQYVQLDYVSLNQEIPVFGIPVILKIDPKNYSAVEDLKDTLSSNLDSVEYFLLESDDQNCNLSTEDILGLSASFPIILGCGLSEKNVNQLIDQSALKGIALRGGDEIKPGYKDFDELADILEAIEVED